MTADTAKIEAQTAIWSQTMPQTQAALARQRLLALSRIVPATFGEATAGQKPGRSKLPPAESEALLALRDRAVRSLSRPGFRFLMR